MYVINNFISTKQTLQYTHPFIEAYKVSWCVKTGYWQWPSVPDTSCASFKLPNTGSNHSVNFLFYTLKKKWLWVFLTWEIRHWSFCWLSLLERSQSNNGYLRIFKDLISEMSSLQGSIPFALPSCLFLRMAINVKSPDRGVHPQKAKLKNRISGVGLCFWMRLQAATLEPGHQHHIRKGQTLLTGHVVKHTGTRERQGGEEAPKGPEWQFCNSSSRKKSFVDIFGLTIHVYPSNLACSPC